MKINLILVCVFVISFSAGFINAEENNELSSKVSSILKNKCYSCHKGPGSEGGNFDVQNVLTMTTPRNNEKPYVIIGNPESSYLFQRIHNNQMPPKETGVVISADEKEIIQKWIKEGAKPFNKVIFNRNYVSWIDILKHVNQDLEQLEKNNPFDVKYTRYFTLANLHNNKKYTDAELSIFKSALSKAINSLSWRRNILLPRPIDNEQTIFAVDLRKLNWDVNAEKVWQTITYNYPYGIRFEALNVKDAREINKLLNDICRKTYCDIPVLRADWFVTAATRPPLYHEILRIPDNANTLEKKLDVNPYLNFERNEIARAGFNQSGISKQNRLVERHDANYGAYWKSYDFLPNNDYSNLTMYPLGPDFAQNKYKNHIFKHDGGEIIFNLPNGLQGYMLVDGKGNRINEGPIDVVSDSNKFSGTASISNGISCMGCHKNGMIRWPEGSEAIRNGNVVKGETLEKVVAIYPDKKKMTDLLKQDEKLFLTSLREAIVPFVPEKAADLSTLREMEEPISYLVKKHRDDDLAIETVAAELDEKNPHNLILVIQANQQLNQELGLNSLIQPNGTIKRSSWEKIDTYSMFQKCCSSMGKGYGYLIQNLDK